MYAHPWFLGAGSVVPAEIVRPLAEWPQIAWRRSEGCRETLTGLPSQYAELGWFKEPVSAGRG